MAGLKMSRLPEANPRNDSGARKRCSNAERIDAGNDEPDTDGDHDISARPVTDELYRQPGIKRR